MAQGTTSDHSASTRDDGAIQSSPHLQNDHCEPPPTLVQDMSCLTNAYQPLRSMPASPSSALLSPVAPSGVNNYQSQPDAAPPSPQPLSNHSHSEFDLAASNKLPHLPQSSVSRVHQDRPPPQSEPCSSTLTCHRTPVSGETHAQQHEASLTISSTPQPRLHKRTLLSPAKQRTQRNIEVINATFAVCQGTARAGATRFERSVSRHSHSADCF